MASTLIGILLSVLIITGKVAAQSFDFTCPKAWTDGAIENMMCVIPRATFNDKTNGGSCDFYYDSVLFKVTLSDQTSSSPCTVTGFDSKCDGSLNTNGCGCREISGGNIVIDYNITAVQADHEGARWECIPQCLDSNGDLTILSPPDRPECANTTFVITTTTTLTTTSAATTADTTDASTESPTSSSGNTSSGPFPTTGNSSTSTTTSTDTGVTSISTQPSVTTSGTNNGGTGHPDSVSDMALFIGVGFVGLVCLVAIVMVTALVLRERKNTTKDTT